MKLISSKSTALAQKLKMCHESGNFKDLENEYMPFSDLRKIINSLKLEIEDKKELISTWINLIISQYKNYQLHNKINDAKFINENDGKIKNIYWNINHSDKDNKLYSSNNDDDKFKNITEKMNKIPPYEIEILLDEYIETFLITKKVEFLEGIKFIFHELPIFIFKYFNDLKILNFKELKLLICELEYIYRKIIDSAD
ncbi:hypothetical protein DMUE_2217 [Dictyocoela muelleri]|nr:hypothetical protein DMUE_2217 [Dictyocoela muelleri]